MPNLLLQKNDFLRMKEELSARFGNRANFDFADAPTLDHSLSKMKADSFR
jgi:hypothetical protein